MRGVAFDADSGVTITPFLPEWIVPLQPIGTLRPLFVFPASHSDPAMRADTEIARQLGSERPAWGLAHATQHRDLVRNAGVAALGAEYVQQMRVIQPVGPYLLFGNCLGGYLAWEAARQLLAQGQEIAGIAFYEVPLRAAFAQVRSGPIPVDATNIWRLGHYYCPEPLPVFLTHLMTREWHAARWWQPWQQVACVGTETVLLPDGVAHAERMTTAIRDWIEAAEA